MSFFINKVRALLRLQSNLPSSDLFFYFSAGVALEIIE